MGERKRARSPNGKPLVTQRVIIAVVTRELDIGPGVVALLASRENQNELVDEELNEEDMDDDHEAFTEKYKQLRVERMERWNILNETERKRKVGTNANNWRTKDYKIEE